MECHDPDFRVHSLNDLAEVQPLIAAAGFRETEVQQALGTMRFPTPTHMVRRYGALHSLEVTPAVSEALVCDVTDAVADWPALLQPAVDEAALQAGKLATCRSPGVAGGANSLSEERRTAPGSTAGDTVLLKKTDGRETHDSIYTID